MTIAAGILCRDGVVLGTESEITTSSMKTTRNKIFRTWAHDSHLRAVMATVGDYDFAKAAMQFTDPVFETEQPPTAANVRSALQDAVSEMYENHVWKNPNPSLHRDFGLMAALWGKDQGFFLFKTVETAVIRIQSYEVMGSGGDLADYILKKHVHEDIPVAEAVGILIYMLSEVKKHGQGCGGETAIAVLEEHRYSEVTQEQVDEYEAGMMRLDDLARQVFQICFDPERTTPTYHKAVDKAAELMKTIRGPMLEREVKRRAALRDQQPPTYDQLGPPPSPE